MALTKENIFKITTVIAVLVAVVLLVWVNMLRHDKASQNSIIEEKNAQTEYYKNKQGEEVASRLVAEADLKYLKEYYPVVIDSIKSNYDVKIRNLESYISADIVSQGDVLVKVDTVYVEKDGVPQMETVFAFHDDWLSLDGVIRRGMIDINWETRNELSLVLHRSREGWFKPKQLLVDAKLSNPYSKVENLKSIKVGEERNKRFGLGIYVGYGTRGVDVGIGLQYSFIRF